MSMNITTESINAKNLDLVDFVCEIRILQVDHRINDPDHQSINFTNKYINLLNWIQQIVFVKCVF